MLSEKVKEFKNFCQKYRKKKGRNLWMIWFKWQIEHSNGTNINSQRKFLKIVREFYFPI